MPRRVVITSLGMLTPLGDTETRIANAFRTDCVPFARFGSEPRLVVAPCPAPDLRSRVGTLKERRYLTRSGEFMLAAAADAISQSQLTREHLHDAGIFIGCGPNLDVGGEFPEVQAGHIDRVDLPALFLLRLLPNTVTAVTAKWAGIHGENGTLCTACTGSLQALGEAFRRISGGYLDVALAGGTDSRLNPSALLAYKKAGAPYMGDARPEEASRPFDAQRAGFVPGEGAACFVLESLEHAQARGAPIWAEIMGYGTTMDGASLAAPDAQGTYASVAIQRALTEANWRRQDVEVISAHGTATPLNDASEAAMIAEMFGNQPWVVAFKSWIGHLASACGAAELACLLVCARAGFLPGIRNLCEPCHDNVRFVRTLQPVSVHRALLRNSGFGGQNAALAVRLGA